MVGRGRSLAAIINVVLIVIAGALAVGLFGVAAGAVMITFHSGIAAEIAAAGSEFPDRATILGLLALAVPIIIGTLLLVLRLRRVIATVQRGDPFHPRNPRDLRIVAGLLAFVTLLTTVPGLFLPQSVMQHGKVDFDLSSWLAVLIILVMAEVFAEGARLRADAELVV